jgi:hypothetical protein
MSAFIVEDRTIARIVNWLVREVGNNPESYKLKEKLSKLGYDLTSDSQAEKLAKDMLELNMSAVNQRYHEENPVPSFSYVPGVPTSLIQTLKSLNCWIYQCTEGDVPKQSSYKFFADDVQRYLLRAIVYDLPEYDRAEWA